ncbi:MAG: hypothetical protein WDO24_31150 [Pseudomonadota bacterium]
MLRRDAAEPPAPCGRQRGRRPKRVEHDVEQAAAILAQDRPGRIGHGGAVGGVDGLGRQGGGGHGSDLGLGQDASG